MTVSTAPTASPTVRLLSHIHGLLGWTRYTRSLLDARALRATGRRLLRQEGLADPPRRRDVTVVIGVRDRADHRLTNALVSIGDQSLDDDLVEVVVVDYGSGPAAARSIAEQCAEHGARYVRAEAPRWSRGRCLNLALAHVDTHAVVLSDVDVVFSSDYLAEALDLLAADPLSMVGSAMLDLPEDSTPDFELSARSGEPPPIERWRPRCTVRHGWSVHPSILAVPTAVVRLLGGYDEYYELWGSEDEDLADRLWHLGLTVRTVPSTSAYLHQWHPPHEGVPGGAAADRIALNHHHRLTHRSLVRNRSGRAAQTSWSATASSPSRSAMSRSS